MKVRELLELIDETVPADWDDTRRRAVLNVASLLASSTQAGQGAEAEELLKQAVSVVEEADDNEVRDLAGDDDAG